MQNDTQKYRPIGPVSALSFWGITGDYSEEFSWSSNVMLQIHTYNSSKVSSISVIITINTFNELSSHSEQNIMLYKTAKFLLPIFNHDYFEIKLKLSNGHPDEVLTVGTCRPQRDNGEQISIQHFPRRPFSFAVIIVISN
jgi:hypothetical protein